MRGVTGQLFQRRPDRLGDQLQTGEVPCGGQYVGGVGALTAPPLQPPGDPQPLQRQIQQPISPIINGETVPEVRQHAVMEARIVQLHRQGVFEVDPAPHRLGHLAIGQVVQELQHAHRGQLRR
jgi:hypothetical protein